MRLLATQTIRAYLEDFPRPLTTTSTIIKICRQLPSKHCLRCLKSMTSYTDYSISLTIFMVSIQNVRMLRINILNALTFFMTVITSESTFFTEIFNYRTRTKKIHRRRRENGKVRRLQERWQPCCIRIAFHSSTTGLSAISRCDFYTMY